MCLVVIFLLFVLTLIFLNKNVRVELIIVEVIKLHRATREGVHLVVSLILFSSTVRHDDALLEEMGSCDHCVSIQLPVVLDLLDSK